MAEFYRFFDSTIDDPRKYDADEFAEYFRQILTDGIFNGGTNLQVTCDNSNMKVKVNEGYGWIKGYLYKVDIEGMDLLLDNADVTNDRIDRIVLRWDEVNRYIKAFVLKGVPAASPIAPSLTRNDDIYEISLAQVRVIAGKSFISGTEITDERLDTSVCGLVNSLIQVDTTVMQQTFDSFMAEIQGLNPASQSEVDNLSMLMADFTQNLYNLKELPNGIKDDVKDGKYTQRIEKHVIQSGDITNLVTTGINIDYVTIPISSFANAHSNIGDYNPASTLYEGKTKVCPSGIDIASNIGKYAIGVTNMIVMVAKGTYADLAAAQADLVGTVLTYQSVTEKIYQLSDINFLSGRVQKNIVITSANWIDDTATSGYWYYEVIDANVDVDTIVNVNIHKESMSTALDAEISSASESFMGSYRVYAKKQPSVDIVADINKIRGMV